MASCLVCCFVYKVDIVNDVNETISFQKLVGNLDKMITVNLGRQHHKTLDSYFKSY